MALRPELFMAGLCGLDPAIHVQITVVPILPSGAKARSAAEGLRISRAPVRTVHANFADLVAPRGQAHVFFRLITKEGAPDYRFSFLDGDREKGAAPASTVIGACPWAMVQTSLDNYHAWFFAPHIDSRDGHTSALQDLYRRFQGDRGACRCGQDGRLPGSCDQSQEISCTPVAEYQTAIIGGPWWNLK